MGRTICLDTALSGHLTAIAAYLIPYSGGAILVDPGPGSTVERVCSLLKEQGYSPEDVTHVFLTHIHLDHAGSAGWWAKRGAQIFVHPVGAPHLLNPEKLLASTKRIYGDKMESTWGEFLPVPADSITQVQDGENLRIGEIRLTGIHTPGHAEHHVTYLFDDCCFAGDIGGVRKPGQAYVRLPFVPPETHLGKWRRSLAKIQDTGCTKIAVTHFGLFEDAPTHLKLALQYLDEVEQWLEQVMPDTADVETLLARYVAWLHERGRAQGVDEDTLTTYDFASPVQMGATGLFRYWHKIRLAEQ